MKKILFVAMAATMFAACTQNEELENAASNKEMKFNTAVMSTTRGTAISNTTFSKFTLYAYYGTEGNTKEIIGGVDFSKTGETWSTSDSKTFYWPGENEVNFWGYSAVDADGNTSKKITNYDETNKTFKFEVQAALDDQEDLLVADVVGIKSTTAGGTASISFKHALTKMSFKVIGQETSADFSYNVTGIEISAKATETYDFSTSDWKNTAETTATKFTLTAPAEAISGATPKDVTGFLMMIPQTGATITVTYSVTAGSYTETNLEKTFTFDDWAKGKNIAYTITLPADKITPMTIKGTAEDTGWDTPNDGNLTPKTDTPAGE